MSNIFCPYCGGPHILSITSTPDGFHCCACRADFDEDDLKLERYVRERFAAMFPLGSDGPPSDFDMADLYADAHAWLAHEKAGDVDGLPLTWDEG